MKEPPDHETERDRQTQAFIDAVIAETQARGTQRYRDWCKARGLRPVEIKPKKK